MHPIEHLRLLARSGGIDGETLVGEAAIALGSLPDDPAMLVVVCRRLIDRHPTVAALWWLCSSVLVAESPSQAAWELYERHEFDDPYRTLVDTVPVGATVAVAAWGDPGRALMADRPDVTLIDLDESADQPVDLVAIDVVALSAERLLVDRQVPNAPLWAVCRLGVRVHDRVVGRIAEHGGVNELPVSALAMIVDDAGASPPTAAALRDDGPFAPELLRSGVV